MTAPQQAEDGCQTCSAPTEMFMCTRCTSELKRMLTALFRGDTEHPTPGLLEHLGEAALGMVRMDTGGGRRQRRAGLIQYTDPKPATDGLGGTEGQRRLELDAERGKLSLRSVLRAGGLNPKACNLLEETHNLLVGMVDVLTRYGSVPPAHFAAVPRASIPASFQLAKWLTGQMAAIPAVEESGWMYERLEVLTRTIEKTIDRPEPLKTCGPCPTLVGHRQECGTALEAKKDDREVTCPVCNQTYDVEQRQADLLRRSDDKLFTVRELTDIVLPRIEEPVPQKTLETWINRGWVESRGSNETGAQMVRLGDVRETRRNRPRHKRAG